MTKIKLDAVSNYRLSGKLDLANRKSFCRFAEFLEFSKFQLRQFKRYPIELSNQDSN